MYCIILCILNRNSIIIHTPSLYILTNDEKIYTRFTVKKTGTPISDISCEDIVLTVFHFICLFYQSYSIIKYIIPISAMKKKIE